jgi:hypothetical protein
MLTDEQQKLLDVVNHKLHNMGPSKTIDDLTKKSFLTGISIALEGLTADELRTSLIELYGHE